MSPSQNVPFLIAGGGIGGLATALALALADYPVYVLEKASQFGEVGAGLQLGPNAIRVLQHLGILDHVLEYAVQPQRLVLKDAIHGEELSALRVGGESFRERYHAPYVVMHRVDLLNVLLDACRQQAAITLELNKDVISVDDWKDGYRVTCQDGSVYETGALIGADGLNSNIRKLIAADDIVGYPYACYRGTLPVAEVLTYANLNDVVLWLGPGLHLVQYPVHRGEVYNQVAVFHSSSYQPGKDPRNWGTPQELDVAFRGCCPTVQNAVSMIRRDRKWIMYDRDPISRWTRGRATLIGDAAHPMLQYLAQGACQALEDAAYLAYQVRIHQRDIEAAFEAYAKERTVRTARVQTNARRFGDILHTGEPLSILLRNRVLKDRSEDDCRDVDWLYGYQIEGI